MTLQKLIRTKMRDMSLGELRQALLKSEKVKHDFVLLYENEYNRSKKLQNRIDVLKNAQRAAHLEFRGLIE